MRSPPFPKEAMALRGLQESREMGVAHFDAGGVLCDANDAFARWIGVSRDALVGGGWSFERLLPDGGLASVAPVLAEMERNGLVADHRMEIVRANGERAWAAVALVRTTGASAGHVLLVLDDVTRYTGAAERRRAWRLYREFLDAAPDLVVMRDGAGGIVWANGAFLAYHRASLPALVGLPGPSARDPGTQAAELAVLDAVRRTGIASELPPERLQSPDGEERFFYTSVQPFRYEGVSEIGTISVSRDGTDRARAERALARSEANLRTAQAIAQMGSWEIHLRQPADDYWSEETYQILGIDPATHPPSPERYIQEIVHPEDRAAAVRSLAEIQHSDRRLHETYRIVRPDGATRWVMVQANLVRDAHGDLERIVGTMRDVSQQRQSEEVQRGLEERLRQAQKLEAVGTLAGGIAHDFNNLLSALAGYAELALHATRDNPKAQADLQQVLLAASRGADLVARLLTFSRQQNVPRRPLRIEAPVRDAIALLRAKLPAGIAIRDAIDPETPLIAGDETQILQVIMNLGTNAIHGMDGRGGVLEVRLEPCSVSEEAALASPGLSPGPHVRLIVSDTGAGMEPRVLDRVLEPFFTTKPAGVGTGLGLSVVHGIVRDYGGALDVESTPGAGTTVRVLLPALSMPMAEAPPDAFEAPFGRGERVLVVDDEAALAELERRRLEGLGYAPLVFTDARLALAAFRSDPGQFDLVLTDQAMPDLSGVELAREIRAIRPDLPVILISGHRDAVSAPSLEAAGIHAYLRKPVDRRGLAEALAAASSFEASRR